MIQSIVDIVLYGMNFTPTNVTTFTVEPASSSSTLLVSLLQEVLNIFNTCHPSETFVSSLCMHINACLSELPSAQMICLPTISAGYFMITAIKMFMLLPPQLVALLCLYL